MNNFQEPIKNTNHQIMFVKPEVEQYTNLIQSLSDCGYAIAKSEYANDALKLALTSPPDLILISNNSSVNQVHDSDLISKLREAIVTPIVVLAHDNNVHERIEAYQQGVDDYIPMPAAQTEIILRIENIMRRYNKRSKSSTSSTELGELQVSDAGVTWRSMPIDLTQTEKELLNILVKFFGKPLSKAYLQMLVLKRPFSRYDRSIDMHISNVRKKLATVGHPPEKIIAVRGYGYCYR